MLVSVAGYGAATVRGVTCAQRRGTGQNIIAVTLSPIFQPCQTISGCAAEISADVYRHCARALTIMDGVSESTMVGIIGVTTKVLVSVRILLNLW